MTAQETIIKYLRGRKTGATVPEIVAATGINKNTVRRIVGNYSLWHGMPLASMRQRNKCRVTGKQLSAYGVQS